MNVIITILLIILVIFILWQVLIRVLRRFFDFPAPAFIGKFLDSDFRRKMQPPDKIISRSKIKEGMKVLEVGCGSGAFTTFVARAVGDKGEVFALDIQPEMLKQIENKLKQPENKDIKNIHLIEGDALNMPLEDNTFDLVYSITVFQELPDKNKALKEMKRVLKPNGILAITEFLPDPDYPLKSTTVKIGTREGFILDDIGGNFWNYTARFIKPHN
ncbi:MULTISPECIES: class I SAM-dependent methyltransferase [Methanobacterium]|jgi:ubiquinone/menaquinone biosynthesis C-methylase UbiE|uniref:Methyltransferase domain-containing protein n=1 Tax=Methanobacterium veterum TaxID=408577 RepID=A0A9E5A5Z5_9EURY|nr:MULTISPECIES: methyltransferase domain-containing protein [Methanobacterium]MCZ3365217.1 methyltransferase domain-containing protein [Methanobacterium veterum]MCZ3372972.1 methyltransferase domain-containing protein [Methanobacterium veterum]